MTRLALALILALGCSSNGSGETSVEPDAEPPSSPDDPNDPNDPGADSPDPFDQCAGTDTGTELDNELCLVPDDDPTAEPLVVIEAAEEDYNGTAAIHVRLTFNPSFVDNTFGTGSVGWGNKAHKFDALVGSDHARVILLDAGDNVVFDLKLDYITADPTAPCGFRSLGPFDGDGAVNAGDETAILAWTTSLDKNLNDRGLCLTENSPPISSTCGGIDPAFAEWDFRVVYDLWVAKSAFDPTGFGRPNMESVHASPSKGESTVDVVPADCPDDVEDGCLDPEECPDGECEVDDDCGVGEHCEGGVCEPIVQ